MDQPIKKPKTLTFSQTHAGKLSQAFASLEEETSSDVQNNCLASYIEFEKILIKLKAKLKTTPIVVVDHLMDDAGKLWLTHFNRLLQLAGCTVVAKENPDEPIPKTIDHALLFANAAYVKQWQSLAAAEDTIVHKAYAITQAVQKGAASSAMTVVTLMPGQPEAVLSWSLALKPHATRNLATESGADYFNQLFMLLASCYPKSLEKEVLKQAKAFQATLAKLESKTNGGISRKYGKEINDLAVSFALFKGAVAQAKP